MSEDDDEIDYFQFLGEGYYFWDYNIKRARKWGKKYKGQYRILEVPMILQGERFIDLAGSRLDLLEFIKLYQKYGRRFNATHIGGFITGMQTLEKMCRGSWPYTVIRAQNIKPVNSDMPFNTRTDAKMLLNPEIIICFYDKNEIILKDSRVIK